jgi:hypothetical protein
MKKISVMVLAVFLISGFMMVAFSLQAYGAAPIYKALNPRGSMPEMQLTPLAPRPGDLNDKVVYIINSWKEGSELEGVLAETEAYLKKHFPGVKVVSIVKPSAYMSDDPELWEEMSKKANAFVYGAAPSCSTTFFAIMRTAGMEKRNIPGVALVYNTLIDDAKGATESVATPVRFVAVPYPPRSMSSKETQTAMEQVVKALTTPPTDHEKKTGMYRPQKPPRLAVTGTLDQVQDHFYKKGWTDGLPIIAPTEENLKAMLKGTKHAPTEVVTNTMWPEKWEVTVEKVAINGIMAGCRPEYMPVLLAAVEAFAQWDNASSVRSTNSFSFMQLVNGPIRKEIDMNSGIYALGPGNQANATIGRALRLMIINLGGGQVGVNIMGVQGNVSGYSFCFAENEESSPWEPFSVGQGFKANESTVTVFSGGWSHVGNYISEKISMERLAKDISVFEWPNGVTLLLSPQRAKMLHQQGLKKQDVEDIVWKNATSTMKEFKSSMYYPVFIEPILKGRVMYGEKYLWPKEYLDMPDDAVVSIYPRKYVRVIVVGGEISPMMQAWKVAYPSTASVDKWR